MTRINVGNVKIKRRYLDRLKQAKGLSESSIVSIERALNKYDEFADGLDYRAFTSSKAVAFRKWLTEHQGKDKPVSAATAYYVIRQVRGFFMWLSGEPGFRSKITADSVTYLSLDLKTVRAATSPKFTSSPTLDYVLKLVQSIEPVNEIDVRDRALIAFLLLSGMRVLAIATLPLGCFDPETNLIDQDPAKGVHTKFGKTIITKLLPFDRQLLDYVLEWHKYLATTRLFGQTDPFFPSTKMQQSDDGFSFEAVGVEPVFWSTASPIHRILRERSEHARLPYFKPHAFRHAAIHLAMRFSRNAEETKALSQNFGHENIGTTLLTYGNLDTYRVIEVIKKMDFGGKAAGALSTDQINEMIGMLESLKDKTD